MHDSLIAFNNGLGYLKAKSEGGIYWGLGEGNVLGEGFCLEGSLPFNKSDQMEKIAPSVLD